MTTPDAVAHPGRRVALAFGKFTLLRFVLFGVCWGVALAVALPVTGGKTSSRVIVCAALAAVVSVPLSLVLGRGLRAELAASLDGARQTRLDRERDYDDRVRAAMQRPADKRDAPPAD